MLSGHEIPIYPQILTAKGIDFEQYTARIHAMIYNVLPSFPIHTELKAATVRMRIATNKQPKLGSLFDKPTNVFKPEEPAIGKQNFLTSLVSLYT